MKRVLSVIGALGVLIGFIGISHAVQVCQKTDIMCYESGPSGNLSTPFRVDAAGNVTTAGNLATTGNNTWNGQTVYTPSINTTVNNNSTTGTSTNVTMSSISVVNPYGATYITLLSTGANVTIGQGGGVSLLAISTATAVGGEYIILVDTSSVGTVTMDSGTAAGFLAQTFPIVVNNAKRPAFVYDAVQALWIEQHD